MTRRRYKIGDIVRATNRAFSHAWDPFVGSWDTSLGLGRFLKWAYVSIVVEVGGIRNLGAKTILIASIAVTGLSGCRHATRKAPVSIVVTADPSLAKQLVGGFYQIEANAWRWTARKFIVTLVPPPGSEQNGATLQLQFAIPESQISKLGPMTLSADVDAHSLSPETYSKAGEYRYTRQIPADLLRTNTVPVIFTFDKASPPTPVDGRELGAVVSLIALNPN